MDKGTGEREKDGVDVKQGSLAAYSIARDVSVLWISSPPPIATSPLSPSFSLSLYVPRSIFHLSLFRSDATVRCGSSSFSSSHSFSRSRNRFSAPALASLPPFVAR